jgi:integrase/recombinase XerD
MTDLVPIRNAGGAVGEMPPASVPALVGEAGKSASLRCNIRNPNTRAAYRRTAAAFLNWCETRAGLVDLRQVQPIHVAAYIEELRGQHLACLRMLFDWLVTGQVIPSNPAHAVRGPRYSVSKGATPVRSSEEASDLLKGMGLSTVVGLRDRAIIAARPPASAPPCRSPLRITFHRKSAGGCACANKTAS